jgi:hypothetical protein
MDNDSDSSEDPLVDYTPTGAYTIYIPTFLDDVHQSQRPLLDLNADLLHKKWLTPDLVRKIEDCFLTKYQISNTLEGDNVRALEDFKVKAAKLLPKGRIFVSFKQLDQVSKMFLDACAINKVHVNKKQISCFYA